MLEVAPYIPKNKIRIVTAASLFDGHDAAINIMRRVMQASGAEVIHLGHDRSALEIVNCAIQEDVQAIAITSYQGGHIEYFKYIYDLLHERGCGHIKIFGGGGGVILPHEINELHEYGISRIYSPDDGRKMGLQGMINDLLEQSDFPAGNHLEFPVEKIKENHVPSIAKLISACENFPEMATPFLLKLSNSQSPGGIPVIGFTGTGGSGKSSLVDEVIRRFVQHFPEKKLAIISVDPTKKKSGGALLGDRIRMNAVNHPNIFMRSLATRQANLALSRYIPEVLTVCKHAAFDLIILETSGIGQSDSEITEFSDVSVYVMTPEYGAASQLEKIDMLDFSDIVVLNKSDKRGAKDALRDVKKQYQRNHKLFYRDAGEMPVFATIASQFNDPGVNLFFKNLMDLLNQKTNGSFDLSVHVIPADTEENERLQIIPPERTRYLAEITDTVRKYNRKSEEQSEIAQKLFSIRNSIEELKADGNTDDYEAILRLEQKFEHLSKKLKPENWEVLEHWDSKKQRYSEPVFKYQVRGREVCVDTRYESLSRTGIPKVVLPQYTSWGDILRWNLSENVPGEFPYAAGVFPFKRENEDPTRMFAGEGGPERTNRRFHYLSKGMPAIRLSTAFDSVTLYGRDPGYRPDIYGKVGNSGVSIASLDDMKKLYSGFNLKDAKTSVSMTINGPAPTLMAFFLNAAIDQQIELYLIETEGEEALNQRIEEYFRKKNIQRPLYLGELPEGNDGLGLRLLGVHGDQLVPKDVYDRIKTETISTVRGTVQADILKEDQAQNTCIFSTDFSLKLMGDVQEYFILNKVRNFYSVSISGYHIAEAGANPISQLAFTLANGFTYVEYYASRGMKIDDFAPNLSFFFSNGTDPEYAVIGRVARLIWAKAMKYLYHANERSQMLKYHIQTSGRSLHAQEISFNDIRTTLQALYAILDNCNSLHTNAYDEAITTPTEESVRRAMAIQMIINHELGLARNQNPLQGSFIIEKLTELVEEAVLKEFERINERGGVLGAMETMYQRGKIQEESMYYEGKKHTGELPIIGVNTFLSSEGSPTIIPGEVIRATVEEKENQIKNVEWLHQAHQDDSIRVLKDLQHAARKNLNIFDSLMEAAKYCSLGQITLALFEVGGQYRRSM